MGEVTMKLHERLYTYANALAYIRQQANKGKGVYYSGICYALHKSVIHPDDDTLEQFMQNFPEIVKRKPKGKAYAEFWYGFTEEGTQKRIKILERAIKEVKAEMRKNNS